MHPAIKSISSSRHATSEIKTDNRTNINVVRKTLSDGSHVFDVTIPPSPALEATTEKDAYDLADGIRDLILKHTNNNPFVRVIEL